MRLHCDIYDTYFDSNNNQWLEQGCPDPECFYCNNRPDTHPDDCKCSREYHGTVEAS